MKNGNSKRENDYLDLTMQQKFNFDSNTFDEENTKKYKKTSSVRKKENQRMKELIKIKEKYKKKYYISLIIILILIIVVIITGILFICRKHTIEEKTVEKYKVVNSGISGNKTYDILENMKERVYRYNPSKIFILIGTNDIPENKTNEEIVNNIDTIIKKIKKNRKEAKIYLESIYPINNTDNDKISHAMVGKRTNENIKEINKKLKKIAQKEKISYIDMYSLLEDSDGNLNLDYTREGLHMSDEGYEVITKKIKQYLK